MRAALKKPAMDLKLECVGPKVFGRHANAVLKMTTARTTIEGRDLGNEDWGPVKASEEVWRIRTRTWDPHLNFTFAKHCGLI